MTYQKVDTGMSKISIFPRAIRYDNNIDIEPIFRYFRYIEASLTAAAAAADTTDALRCRHTELQRQSEPQATPPQS